VTHRLFTVDAQLNAAAQATCEFIDLPSTYYRVLVHAGRL